MNLTQKHKLKRIKTKLAQRTSAEVAADKEADKEQAEKDEAAARKAKFLPRTKVKGVPHAKRLRLRAKKALLPPKPKKTRKQKQKQAAVEALARQQTILDTDNLANHDIVKPAKPVKPAFEPELQETV